MATISQNVSREKLSRVIVSDDTNIPSPDTLNEYENNLFIFDDMDRGNAVREHIVDFARCHNRKDISFIFLSQFCPGAKPDNNIISRVDATHIVLLNGIDRRTLMKIHRQYVSRMDIDLNTFKREYKNAVSVAYGYLVIDKYGLNLRNGWTGEGLYSKL